MDLQTLYRKFSIDRAPRNRRFTNCRRSTHSFSSIGLGLPRVCSMTELPARSLAVVRWIELAMDSAVHGQRGSGVGDESSVCIECSGRE